MQSEVDALTARVAELEALLANVSVDGTTTIVTGDLQVVNGSGSTGVNNGLGISSSATTPTTVIPELVRKNVVIGDNHTYSASATFVSGNDNAVTGAWTAVVT